MQIFYAGVNLTKLIQEKYYKEPYGNAKADEISRDFNREKQDIDNLDIDKEIRKFFTNLSFDEIKNGTYTDFKIDTKTRYRIESDEILEIAKNFKNSEIIKILQEGILQVERLTDAIFSTKKPYNVFLSHSHSDISEVLKIKEDIEKETNKKVFVDSEEWESMYEIEKFMRFEIKKYICGKHIYDLTQDEIQKIYPYIKLKEKCYDIHKLAYINLINALQRRVYSAFDVMLAISLKKIMSKCDYFVFMPTSNSCNISTDKTLSSWIYYENQISAIYFTKKEWYDKYKHGGVSLDDIFNSARPGDFPLFDFPMNYSKLDKIRDKDELLEYIK